MSASTKFEKVKFSIGFKLVAMISLIIIVSLLSMIFIANNWFRDTIEIQKQDDSLRIVMTTALKVEADVNSFVEKANLVASALLGEIGSAKEKDSFRDLFFTRGGDLLFVGVVVKGKGDVLKIKEKIYNDQYFSENGIDPAVVQNAIAGDAQFYEKSFSSQNEARNATPFFGQPVLGLSVPYSKRNQTTADAILVVFVKADKLMALVKSSPTSSNKSFIVNGAGEVLAHHNPAIGYVKTNLINIPIVSTMTKSGEPNKQTKYVFEGKRYLGSFSRIPFAEIGVVTVIEEKAAFEFADRIRNRNMYVAAIVLSLAILIVFFFSKTLTVPVKHLVSATGEIENGNFIVNIVPTTQDEIGLLTQSFVRMGKGLAEREKMKDAFGKFVNKDIAEKILRDEIRLGGERKSAAIFFSDIRNFTSMSESLEPEEVVEFLNQYMTRMVNCVNNTHGVVDKFIGDAIMAVWGTPVSQGNDTENAVNGALMMRESLAQFNIGRGDPKKPVIRIGCGINTGFVLAGQIGSQDRMEYTVIGDAVNLASRIESLNKPLGTDILLSQDSYELVKDIFVIQAMEKIMVKGKSQPQQIYAVLSRKDDPNGIKTLKDLRKLLGINESKLQKFDPEVEEKKYEFIK
jgi:adenylate cyclase